MSRKFYHYEVKVGDMPRQYGYIMWSDDEAHNTDFSSPEMRSVYEELAQEVLVDTPLDEDWFKVAVAVACTEDNDKDDVALTYLENLIEETPDDGPIEIGDLIEEVRKAYLRTWPVFHARRAAS